MFQNHSKRWKGTDQDAKYCLPRLLCAHWRALGQFRHHLGGHKEFVQPCSRPKCKEFPRRTTKPRLTRHAEVVAETKWWWMGMVLLQDNSVFLGDRRCVCRVQCISNKAEKGVQRLLGVRIPCPSQAQETNTIPVKTQTRQTSNQLPRSVDSNHVTTCN